jgi:hypothetical protein
MDIHVLQNMQGEINIRSLKMTMMTLACRAEARLFLMEQLSRQVGVLRQFVDIHDLTLKKVRSRLCASNSARHSPDTRYLSAEIVPSIFFVIVVCS